MGLYLYFLQEELLICGYKNGLSSIDNNVSTKQVFVDSYLQRGISIKKKSICGTLFFYVEILRLYFKMFNIIA